MKAKALAIGNTNYPGRILDNPENDANDIADILIRLGFETTLVLNASAANQDKAITDFASDLDNYDIGLFYFAGHGFQIDNENYLAATDTNFDDPEHAKYSSFPLNILLSYFNKAENKTSIIILDACRELLNKKAWYRSVEATGLAPVFAPKGTIIAFATSPGEKALDGTGKRNGVYTNALLQHIEVELLPIEEMFKRVRNTVFANSKGKQTTWEHTSLTGTFHFNSGQLTHAVTIPYIKQVVQDKLYVINDSTSIDSIISALKSYNWYVQNPAFERFKEIKVASEDINKLFLLGRNILQAAIGSSGAATDFMDDLPKRIGYFQTGTQNHVLNGILYETFFNSFGSFRQDELKKDYLQDLYQLLENPLFAESKNFIYQQLQPFSQNLFYIPVLNESGISLDIELENCENGEFKVKDIKYEGQSVFIKQNDESIWGISTTQTYKTLTKEQLKNLILAETNIPENKLTITYNTNPGNSNIKYPNYYKIIK